jgi:UDP:flavonoid glycosyltransferase YjiC (YdhE family)
VAGLRALFLTHPGYGHFMPLVPLAQALVAADHTVAVASAEGFRDAVEATGLELIPAGIDHGECFRRAAEAQPELASQSAEERGKRVIPDVFIGRGTVATLADSPRLLAWAPDIVVREEGEFAGPLIAAMAGVPCVDHGWGPIRPSALVDLAASALEPLWAANGLTAHPRGGAYEWLYLDPCPPSLQLEPAREVAVLHHIQPQAPELTGAAPAWLGRPDGRPAIYVTLGTVSAFADDPSFFTAIIAAVADEPVDVLITLGPNGDPESFGPQPPHIHIARFVPQAAVLAHCAVAVTNGGSGATIGALAAGVPVLVVPSAASPSQVRNAQAAKASGAGRILDRAEATAARLHDEIRLLLDDRRYMQAAQRISSEVDDMATPSALVPVIEKLAETHEPYQRAD